MNKRNVGRKGFDLSMASSLIMTILNTSIVPDGQGEAELSH
jgi:hypothetical protein